MFQTAHRLLQLQHVRDRGLDLTERLLDAQGLVPILEQVGEDAGGQLQPVVQRHELMFLAFARAIDRAGQMELAKDGHVAALVQLRKSLAGFAVGQRNRLAQVACTVQGEKLLQEEPAETEHAFPDAAFDLVQGPALVQGRLEERLEFRKFLLEDFALENVVGASHAHGGPPCV